MEKHPMTLHGAERLRAELNELKTVKRPAVIAAIEGATELLVDSAEGKADHRDAPFRIARTQKYRQYRTAFNSASRPMGGITHLWFSWKPAANPS